MVKKGGYFFIILALIILGIYYKTSFSPGIPWQQPEKADLSLKEINDQQLAAKIKETGCPIKTGCFKTSYSHAGPSQAHNIELAAAKLRGLVVLPGEIFSFNSEIGPYTLENGYSMGDMVAGGRICQSPGGGVCQVAGTLHNAVLLSGLQVLERYHHSLSVSYIPPGQDAAVTISGGKDYRFCNNSAKPILIWSDAKENSISVSIYSNVEGPQISIKHVILATTPFSKIKEQDPDLPSGQEKEIHPGIEGRTIRYWLEIETSNGVLKRELGTDTLKPCPSIIKVGS